MKNKILKEALEWYEKNDCKSDVFMEDFVDIIVNKTTEEIFKEVTTELKDEFEKGNLQHPFIISNDYYLYLKLKDIKNRLIPTNIDDDFKETDNIRKEKEED